MKAILPMVEISGVAVVMACSTTIAGQAVESGGGSPARVPSGLDVGKYALYEAKPPVAATEIANNYYDLAGLILRVQDIADADMYRTAGVDAVGQGKSVVFRARDTAAAVALLAARRSTPDAAAKRVDVPGSLPPVRCVQYSDVGTSGCSGQAGRYVFSLSTDTLIDAEQATAAQYTILSTNP